MPSTFYAGQVDYIEKLNTLAEYSLTGVSDGVFRLVNSIDATKAVVFNLAGQTTGTVRTYTLPNASTALAGLALTQTFSGSSTFSSTVAFTGSTFNVSSSTASVGSSTGSKTVNIGTGGTSGLTSIVMGSSTAGGRVTVRCSISSTPVALVSAASVVADLSKSDNYTLLLATNAVLAAPTLHVAGQSGSIVVTQDSIGGRTLGFNTIYKFPGGVVPALSTAIGAVDVLEFYVNSATSILINFCADYK